MSPKTRLSEQQLYSEYSQGPFLLFFKRKTFSVSNSGFMFCPMHIRAFNMGQPWNLLAILAKDNTTLDKRNSTLLFCFNKENIKTKKSYSNKDVALGGYAF